MHRLFLLLLLIPLTARADNYTSPYGEWRGQTEYQAFVGTASDPDAHAVIDLVVTVDPQGKVTGGSTENGCRLLGLASPASVPEIVKLKVTLTGCAYADYNRSYVGNLSVFTKERYAKFWLQAVGKTATGKPGTYNLTATLRR